MRQLKDILEGLFTRSVLKEGLFDIDTDSDIKTSPFYSIFKSVGKLTEQYDENPYGDTREWVSEYHFDIKCVDRLLVYMKKAAKIDGFIDLGRNPGSFNMNEWYVKVTNYSYSDDPKLEIFKVNRKTRSGDYGAKCMHMLRNDDEIAFYEKVYSAKRNDPKIKHYQVPIDLYQELEKIMNAYLYEES